MMKPIATMLGAAALSLTAAGCQTTGPAASDAQINRSVCAGETGQDREDCFGTLCGTHESEAAYAACMRRAGYSPGKKRGPKVKRAAARRATSGDTQASLSGQWSLTVRCSWGAATRAMTLTQQADGSLTGSSRGSIKGSVSDGLVRMKESYFLNSVSYQGLVRKDGRQMNGTYTQGMSSETCTWIATR